MPTTDTWDDLKKSFAKYRLQPSPTGMSPRPFNPSGTLRKSYLSQYRKGAASAVANVGAAVDALRETGLLPERPSQVSEHHIRRLARAVKAREIRPARRLRVFWDALIIYRADFTCRYCGRRPRDVLAETKGRRSLRLVVDHCTPIDRAIRSVVTNTYKDLSFENCACACWVCNTLKAHWPLPAFEQELASLARAALRKTRGTGPAG